MPDIWQQFLQLPKAVRNAASTPDAMRTIERLEQTYPGVDLAGFVMRALIKQFPLEELPSRLVKEAGVTEDQARQIDDELKSVVFSSVQAYIMPAMSRVRPAAPANLPTPAQPLVPPKPTPQAPTGAMAPVPALAPEDDQEIASQVERLKSMTGAPPIGIDASAQQIMDQHQLAFADELLTKRALSIMKAHLKGIRDEKTTVEMLTRDPKIGGLGMDADMAANVVRSLTQAAAELKVRGMAEPVVRAAPPVPPPTPRVETVRPTPKPPMTMNPLAPMPPGPKLEAKPAPLTQPPPPLRRPADIPPPPSFAPGELSNPPAPTSTVAPSRRVTERPTMADITKPSRTYGPADEMRSLTLVEFRRLGVGATDSTKKILDKFKHWKNESFKLWSEALGGWRQSEIHQLYLDMGRQSLDQNLPIKEIISLRARQNIPYLSEHEFMSVADLNHQLIP